MNRLIDRHTTLQKSAITLFGISILIVFTDTFLDMQPKIIFMVELVIILLHTLRHPLPYKILLQSPLALFTTLTWFILCSLRLIVIENKTTTDDLIISFLLSLFHAVFFIYILDIFSHIKTRKQKNNLQLNKLYAFLKRDDLAVYLLCTLTFFTALSTNDIILDNLILIMKFELFFILFYIITRFNRTTLLDLINTNKTTTILLLLFILSVTISYYTSPYDVSSKYMGINRYNQTITHILFFIIAYDLFLNIKNADFKIILMIPLSITVLALVFYLTWHNTPPELLKDWSLGPPLNSNIRHTGYLITASTCISIVLLLHPDNDKKKLALYSFILLISSAFLFWTGGRAATISTAMTMILIISYLTYMKKISLFRLVFTCATLTLAIFLSEYFKIFDWNGISNQIQRTNTAHNAVTLTANRTIVWQSVIDSLNSHWLLGLGPNGYIYIPNRFITTIQPHSMIIQFVAEWGLLGATLFCLLLVRALFTILRSLNSCYKLTTTSHLSAIAIIASLSIHGLVDGTYFYAQPSHYLALAFAIALSAASNRQNSLI